MGDWELGEKLGYGRFGLVYACRRHSDPTGEFPWAHKRLQNDMAQSDEVRKRFAREIEILVSLDHENVMPVEDSGEKRSGIPWFVMPKADSGSLKDAIENERIRDHQWVVTVFSGVLRGLKHAHENGVLHRDLKPGNILLFGDTPKISDFGVAKQLDLDGTTLTLTAQELGTQRYMAPEQLADAKRAGPQADVFALGKILAHLLTGNRPDPGPVDLTGVPDEFRFFIDKCCRADPGRRYPDAGAALKAFELILNPPQMALPPLEQTSKLRDEATAALGTSGEDAAIDALSEHFRSHPNEEEVYLRVFPRMDHRLIRAWLTRDLESFRDALTIYDEYAAGVSAWAYGDTVADFYAIVFGITDDIEIQQILVAGMMRTGFALHRFYVADVFVDLVASMSKPAAVELTVEAIDENQSAAAWYADGALRRPLRAPIADAFKRAQQAEGRGQASSG